MPRPPRSDGGSGRDRSADSAPSYHEAFMRQAVEQARKALHIGEIPIGAVITQSGSVLAGAFNQPIHNQDPTAHAEVMVLRRAAKLIGNYRLLGTTLYVTVEPCLMCVGALVNARVGTVVFGVAEPKWGAVRSIVRLDEVSLNHRFDVVEGILEAECRKLMVDFFKFRREDG